MTELPYFVCTMHNGRAEDAVNNLLNGLTEDEARLLERVIRTVSNISSAWGLKTAPHASLLRHLFQRRLIRHLLPNEQNFLEIGPGAGYLSLMLALDGKGVCNSDVTQAYYIYQHYLYDAFGCLTEWTSTNNFSHTAGSLQMAGGKIQHLPWWIYKDLAARDIEINVIIVNHAICEMHPLAVQHLLAIAKRLGFPKFFMESTGLQRTFDKIKMKFFDYSYSLKYSKNDVHIFEHDQSGRARTLITVKRIIHRLGMLIPFIGTLRNELSRIDSELAALYRWFTRRQSSNRSIFAPNHIRYEDVLKLYEQILGKPNFKSIDEEFLDRIKSKTG